MEPIELFSARVCPFAHRTRLALAEKGLAYSLVEIDLRDKPAWYREVNPEGAVPALRQGDFTLRESLIINEYVDELAATPPLLPPDARGRAEARLWTELFSARCVPLFYRLLRARDAAEQAGLRAEMTSALAPFDAELQRRNGPYWFGDQISLTDLACYPWFERWPVLEHYRDLPLPAELTALRAWVEALQARDTVRQQSQPAAFYIAAYVDYAEGEE